MDLQQLWDQLPASDTDSLHLSNTEIMQAISKESSSIVLNLQQRLRIKSYWVLFFLALFVGLMFFSTDTTHLYLLLIAFGFYACAYGYLYYFIRQMQQQIEPTANLSEWMHTQLNIIRRALRVESIITLVSLPIILIGAALTNRFDRNMTFTDIMQDTSFWLIGLGVTILALIVVQTIGKKMNQQAYGKLMDRLTTNIESVEAVQIT